MILLLCSCNLEEDSELSSGLALLLVGGAASASSSGVWMGGQILKELNLAGQVSTFLGTANSSGSSDGTGTSARFQNPRALCTDGTNLFLADGGNHTIRKIVISSGAVSTLAGSAGASGSTDATGSAARFNTPFGITCDSTHVYVSDTMNHTIRKIVISSGEVSTLAGSAGSSGSTDATGSAARFNNPAGLTSDGTNLYVADFSNHTIRKIVISSGEVSTLAGSAGSSGSTDATGSSARFNNPKGVTTEGANLYITDQTNHTIRKLVISSGAVTTLAGSAGSTGSTDATGSAARFNTPVGITTDGVNLYITDSNNQTVRKLVLATNTVTTLAGSAGSAGTSDGTGSAARFSTPEGATVDGSNLYVSDLSTHIIRRLD